MDDIPQASYHVITFRFLGLSFRARTRVILRHFYTEYPKTGFALPANPPRTSNVNTFNYYSQRRDARRVAAFTWFRVDRYYFIFCPPLSAPPPQLFAVGSQFTAALRAVFVAFRAFLYKLFYLLIFFALAIGVNFKRLFHRFSEFPF